MTETLKDLPLEVQGIASINRRGNIIDDGWYMHITYVESGHAHLLAIMILADICYWYTPTITTNERSDVKDYKKKFAADKLQKSYKSLGEKFGVSKRMAQTACYRLKELNLITIEVRDIDDRQGITFLEPISENIKKISCMCLEFQDTPLTFKSDPPSLLKATPQYSRSEHTYTTSETTVHKLEEKEENKKNGKTNEKNDVEVGPDHQGENEDNVVEIKKPEIEQNTESVLLTSQCSYLAVREGATAEDLVAAIKYLKKKPGVIASPVAVLTEAIKREKTNRELAVELDNRPVSEKPVVTPKDKKPVKSTRAKADIPSKTPPSKYDEFYL